LSVCIKKSAYAEPLVRNGQLALTGRLLWTAMGSYAFWAAILHGGSSVTRPLPWDGSTE